MVAKTPLLESSEMQGVKKGRSKQQMIPGNGYEVKTTGLIRIFNPVFFNSSILRNLGTQLSK